MEPKKKELTKSEKVVIQYQREVGVIDTVPHYYNEQLVNIYLIDGTNFQFFSE